LGDLEEWKQMKKKKIIATEMCNKQSEMGIGRFGKKK
jgi:hypothetical protein